MLPPRAALTPIHAKLPHDTSGAPEMSPPFLPLLKRDSARFLLCFLLLTETPLHHNLCAKWNLPQHNRIPNPTTGKPRIPGSRLTMPIPQLELVQRAIG